MLCKLGLDGISNELVKCMSLNAQRYLLTFINKCFEQRRMPADLKSRRVKLSYKGGDARLPINYCLITVNSVFAKVQGYILYIGWYAKFSKTEGGGRSNLNIH